MPNEKARCANCRRKKIKCLPEGKADDESCDRCQQSGLLCGPATLASGASAPPVINRARSTVVEFPVIQYELQPSGVEIETEEDHLGDVFTSGSQAQQESEYHTTPSAMMFAEMNVLGGEIYSDCGSQLAIQPNTVYEQEQAFFFGHDIGCLSADPTLAAQAMPSYPQVLYGPIHPNTVYEQEPSIFFGQDIGSLSADPTLAAQAMPSYPQLVYGPIPPYDILNARATEQQMSIASIEAFASLPMTPSEVSEYNALTYYLVDRMNRLWGNAQTFRKNPKISDLFGLTIAEFFRNTCQLYASAYDIVRDAWYACIASDAMMNNTLSEHTMQAVSKFYVEHYYKAWNAIDFAWKRIREDGNAGDVDVTQLYFAVFLAFSSSACVRGKRESIQQATTIFNRLTELGAAFPIGIDDQGGSDRNWTVRMFLNNHLDDAGMTIRYSSFFLGHKRHEVDHSDGFS